MLMFMLTGCQVTFLDFLDVQYDPHLSEGVIKACETEVS